MIQLKTPKYDITQSNLQILVSGNPTISLSDTLDPELYHIFYVWEYPDTIYLDKNGNKIDRCKIGETSASLFHSIEECVATCLSLYPSRSQPEAMVCRVIFVVPRNFGNRHWTDRRFHAYLRQQGIKKSNKINLNEFYDIHWSSVAAKLSTILTGQSKKQAKLHSVQLGLIDEAISHYDQSPEGVYLIADLCARFGKTLWMLYLINELRKRYGHRIAILPSYWLSTHTSVENEIKQYANFSDMVFIDSRNEGWEDEVDCCFDSRKFPLVAVSLCGDIEAEKLIALSFIPKNLKISFVDEADFGAHTTKSNAIQEKVIGELDIAGFYAIFL